MEIGATLPAEIAIPPVETTPADEAKRGGRSERGTEMRERMKARMKEKFRGRAKAKLQARFGERMAARRNAQVKDRAGPTVEAIAGEGLGFVKDLAVDAVNEEIAAPVMELGEQFAAEVTGLAAGEPSDDLLNAAGTVVDSFMGALGELVGAAGAEGVEGAEASDPLSGLAETLEGLLSNLAEDLFSADLGDLLGGLDGLFQAGADDIPEPGSLLSTEA